jgi:hypothetical protein
MLSYVSNMWKVRKMNHIEYIYFHSVSYIRFSLSLFSALHARNWNHTGLPYFELLSIVSLETNKYVKYRKYGKLLKWIKKKTSAFVKLNAGKINWKIISIWHHTREMWARKQMKIRKKNVLVCTCVCLCVSAYL